MNRESLDWSILQNKEEYDMMLENSEKPVHLILKYHHAGFWSIFNKVMNYLLYYKNIHKISYDVFSNVSQFYGLDEIFGYIFDEYNNTISEELININMKNYITYEATGCFANFLHEDNSWRKKYHDLWNKYIKIKSEVLDKVPEIKTDKKIISILFRHHALAHEQPNKCMPTYQQYENVINGLLELYNNQCIIILATDIYEAEHHFKSKYSHIEIVHPFSVKTSNNDFEAQQVSTYNGNKENSVIATTTILLLAKGDHFIFPNSNMATAALYINPNMQSHFLIG